MREQESTEDDVLARLVERQTKALQELRTALEQKEREVEGLKQALAEEVCKTLVYRHVPDAKSGECDCYYCLLSMYDSQDSENESLKARLAEARMLLLCAIDPACASHGPSDYLGAVARIDAALGSQAAKEERACIISGKTDCPGYTEMGTHRCQENNP